MTTLEIILISIIWIAYGVFSASQHDWYEEDHESDLFFVCLNILFAPVALIRRIIIGVFFWKGD